jgi:hypothetical protein
MIKQQFAQAQANQQHHRRRRAQAATVGARLARTPRWAPWARISRLVGPG